MNTPQDISSQAISTISFHRDYVKVIPLTIDATPLNYNPFLPDTQNNSLNSTVIHNENLNGTRNFTQQDIQHHQTSYMKKSSKQQQQLQQLHNKVFHQYTLI